MNDIGRVRARLDGEQTRLAHRVRVATGHLAEGELVDALRVLEELKNMATGLQVVAAVAFARQQRAEQQWRGVPDERPGSGVAEQIALARRESPARGAAFLEVATALVSQMPRTLEAMAAGVLTERRAQILVQETSCVLREVRAEVDQAVAADLGRLERLGTRRLADLVRGETYRRDPAAVVTRIGHAESERFVSLRAAPDCMARLTALLPVAQGVAALAALHHGAQDARLAGDPRTRAQIMADDLVVRITGQSTPDAVPVAMHLVMPADTLLEGGDQPARSTVMDRSRPHWPDASSPRHPRWRRGYASSTRVRRVAWSPWNQGRGSSPTGSPNSSPSETTPVVPPTATRRSATSTTSPPTRRADVPPSATGKGCANAATTPNTHPGGTKPCC